MKYSSSFLAIFCSLSATFTQLADAKCLFCKGGSLSIDKPFSKGGGLSVDKPFDKGGGLSIDKPLSKGGSLSIDKPFNSRKIGSWGGDVASFVEKHPWETVAAVALVAGGAYLVVYEGYSLQVAVGTKTITLVSGAAAGESSIAAGAGTIAYTALKPASSGKEQGEDSPKSNSNEIEKNIKPVVELPSPLPQIGEKAGDIEKFNYALKVLRWSEHYEPPGSFEPKRYQDTLSPAETTLLKALTVVQSVPDSEADLGGNEQLEDRLQKLVDTVTDIVKTGEPQWSALLDAAAPTTVGDGTAASKAVLTGRLEDQLRRYTLRRVLSVPNPSVKDIKPTPTGPTISAKP
jgi:hypothetical protein